MADGEYVSQPRCSLERSGEVLLKPHASHQDNWRKQIAKVILPNTDANRSFYQSVRGGKIFISVLNGLLGRHETARYSLLHAQKSPLPQVLPLAHFERLLTPVGASRTALIRSQLQSVRCRLHFRLSHLGEQGTGSARHRRTARHR